MCVLWIMKDKLIQDSPSFWLLCANRRSARSETYIFKWYMAGMWFRLIVRPVSEPPKQREPVTVSPSNNNGHCTGSGWGCWHACVRVRWLVHPLSLSLSLFIYIYIYIYIYNVYQRQNFVFISVLTGISIYIIVRSSSVVNSLRSIRFLAVYPRYLIIHHNLS